jgi:hypothetical protein
MAKPVPSCSDVVSKLSREGFGFRNCPGAGSSLLGPRLRSLITHSPLGKGAQKAKEEFAEQNQCCSTLGAGSWQEVGGGGYNLAPCDVCQGWEESLT